MIRPQEILSYDRGEPFRPFRIQMARGRTMEIRHPKTITVGTNFVIVFTFADDSLDIYDRWETTSLALIESISYLETPVV